MNELKEPEIKLFGRKIVLPENGKVVAGEPSDVLSDECSRGSETDTDRCTDDDKANGIQQEEEDTRKSDEEKQQTKEGQLARESCEIKVQQDDQHQEVSKQSQNPDAVLESADNPRTPSNDEDDASKNEAGQNETTNSQQKTLKKPDKLLPCPRCNSMDTKFCYYNNYNVNQPRHFCKSCQRYWTDGGTMRNVPVGAGRRKNKNSASHCRHITISEALQASRIDIPNGFQFKPNGTVLSFGQDSPLCESMGSVLNLANKKVPNGIQNGDDCSSSSCVTTMKPTAEGVKNGMVKNVNGFHTPTPTPTPTPVPCIPSVPWPVPWSFPIHMPAICPTGFPMPFYPTPYYIPNGFNMSGLSIPSPTGDQKSGSNPDSPLGKHSRDGELIRPNNPEGSGSSIVIPKTLRIDDPDEAAKSSIWDTLGIKYNAVSREELFKALQPKGDEKKSIVTPSSVLQANPAALSRSISFQETA